MTLVRLMAVCASLLALLTSGVSAQQVRHGSIQKVDELNGSITIRTTPQVRTMPRTLINSLCRTAYCSTPCAKERRWRSLFRKLTASRQSSSWKKSETWPSDGTAQQLHKLIPNFDRDHAVMK